MSTLLGLLSVLVLTGIAVIGLHKDWQQYRSAARVLLLVLTVTSLLVSAALIWTSDQQRIADAKQADASYHRQSSEITRLREAVRSAQASQQKATAQFLEAFDRLQQRISDLQARAQTAELRKELATYQKELAATRRTLFSKPRARLTVGLFTTTDPHVPQKQLNIKTEDHVIPVELLIGNKSDAAALTGELTFRICELCEYAEEPQRLHRVQGSAPTDRSFIFDAIGPDAELSPPFSLKVRIPLHTKSFSIGVRYVCMTCVNQPTWQLSTVHVK
ncbi:MAG: hypothetical protein DMF56_23045 [Acidobacteria bacterium]|nr:MAG: hypothetical protein DMF56_23045 [Acidobacteriota bacterium]